MATLNKTIRRIKIKKHIRRKLSGTTARPRLSVFRSNKDIYAQIIDDSNNTTLVSTSSVKIEKNITKVEQAKKVGLAIAKLALDKGISTVAFDRGGYLYHGRVKALAEGAREAGLQF
jgi:large subunit ribosomal protein L18